MDHVYDKVVRERHGDRWCDQVKTMETHKVEVTAGVEMNGDVPHPPALTTMVRPNFFVGEHHCLCFVLETTPAREVAPRDRGTFKAHVVFAEDALPLFVKGGRFELRSAKRVFAIGHLREVTTINEAETGS